ncbi:MAG: hypothetical protein PWR27_1988 [Petroclostridium sp.]|jgi:CxxC motif-containing protein|uniref:DUF1667 domain-containing protein n=1 Tax=Petroclostridium xylanilyticum TaxID=1792311 RepID=UPI000B986B6C|nr:DUF1667 domain-containing protein [Petroclostridium xylanilyticum]MBZ4646725.1 NAD(FAD)-dependent dehydrogenase [Clostridia bacterium]MDK2811279.1 hypothetical protein [Petroclostridium sp.]
MKTKRNLTCIVCPLGCSLEVTLEDGRVGDVQGYGCKRGIAYGQSECTNPTRMLTTTVKVKGGQFPLVSVKSDKPLPKDLILRCMKVINNVQVNAPVCIGDIVVENILDTDVNIVATRNVDIRKAEEKRGRNVQMAV